jgi:hypothetical protein
LNLRQHPQQAQLSSDFPGLPAWELPSGSFNCGCQLSHPSGFIMPATLYIHTKNRYAGMMTEPSPEFLRLQE